MDWGNITKLENDAIKVPDRWLHLHYYEALNVLFRVENALRMLVYVALKNEYRDKWARTSLNSEDGETTISAIASKRRTQASTFGYLTYPVTSPLMYITTGELTKIIETQWELFRPYFLGGKEIVSMKLAEIISVRNSFAHFRPIKSDDVETIKQLSKHVLTAAEKELAEMLDSNNTVPTNTAEKWYTDLKLLNSKHVKLSFTQSTNEKWITICLTYQPPITARNKYGDTHSFETMKFHSPALLSEYRELASNLTYVTELCFGIVEMGGSKEKIEKLVYLGF
ncbi:MAG: hypothetical protein LAQ69_51855, partial [Acidobacteriia bacterium]|nr:hypothetical protein [Terriglobia bacterium]